MKLLHIAAAIVFATGSFSAAAQDPFFSQAFRAPLSLNPALAGADQQTAYRVQSNLRSQWWGGGMQPYKTGSVSLERKIAIGEGGNALALAAGFQNETSNGGVLKNNFFSVGAAYHNALDKEGRHAVAVGLLGTYANRMLDPMKATTQSQFGSFGFMRGTTAYDPVMNQTNRYVDMQAGVGYTYSGEKWNWHVGGALYHAARPNDGAYANDSYQIPRRAVLEGAFGYRNKEGGKLNLRANIQRQADHQVEQVAVDYRLPFGEAKDGTALTFGLGARIMDSFFPYVQLEWHGLAVGLSYDRVTGQVHRYYNQVQSAELTLAYGFGKK